MGSMQLNLFDPVEFVRWCEELFAAYFEYRGNKRNTPSARAFERELFLLAEELYMRKRTAHAETFARVHPGAKERLERAAVSRAFSPPRTAVGCRAATSPANYSSTPTRIPSTSSSAM